MLCRPARKRITAKPMYFQVMMIISDQMAMSGSDSQSTVHSGEPDLDQQVVDRAGGLEHEAPAGADDDLGHDVGHEDQHADDRAAAHLLVEQQRQPDGGRALEDQGRHHDEAVVHQRLVERAVAEDDERSSRSPTNSVGRAEALPLVEAVVRRHQHREDDERDEQQDGGAREDPDLQSLAPVRSRCAAAGRPGPAPWWRRPRPSRDPRAACVRRAGSRPRGRSSRSPSLGPRRR